MILYRYLFKQIAGPFVVATGIVTFIGVMSQVLRLLERVFEYGLGFWAVVKMLGCAALPLLTFTLPAGLLLAVLVGIGRLSSDSEMIAMRAAGISLWQLLPAVLSVSLIATVATLVVAVYGAPWGLRTIEETFFNATKEKAAAVLPEKAFKNDFFGVTIYVEEVDPDGSTLTGVFLADERNPDQSFVVTAREGEVVPDISNGKLVLTLRDAAVDLLADREANVAQRVTFAQLDLTLASDLATRPSDDPYRMFPGELREYLASLPADHPKRGRLFLAFHKRFSQPISCLVFGFLGLALGISDPRSGRSRGVAVAVVLLLSYYLLMRGGDGAGERGALPPFVAAWGAVTVFAALAAHLFWARAREVPNLFERIWQRIRPNP